MVGVWGCNITPSGRFTRKAILVFIALLVFQNVLQGQDSSGLNFTMQDVLAHNDYQKDEPFHHAYQHRVGIMEADLYYDQNQVWVAHDPSELGFKRKLETLYLQPLREKIARFGKPYPEENHSLVLMLDIKNESDRIMSWIISLLDEYPDIFGEENRTPPHVYLVISGDRPTPDTWASLPASIKIDGRLTDQIPRELRDRIHMVSSSFQSVIPGHFDRKTGLSNDQMVAIQKTIRSVHDQNLKIRFWGVPDEYSYWKLQDEWGIDIVGCDHLDELASHLD